MIRAAREWLLLPVICLLIFVTAGTIQPNELEAGITPEHLIVGPQRMLARVLAHQFLAHDIPVSLFVHDKKEAQKLFSNNKKVEIFADSFEDGYQTLRRAAQGKKCIYFCMHYPYHDWGKKMLRATESVVRVAREVGATIVFPSVFYVLGKEQERYGEMAEINPCSSLGKVFKQVERRLCFEAAAKKRDKRGCDVVILRHPSPFGPHFEDQLTSRVFEGAAKGGKLRWIHRTDLPYQFAYAPDIADIMIELAVREDRPPLSFVHYAGTQLTVDQWFKAIAKAADIPCKKDLDSRSLINFFARFRNDAAAGKDILYTFEKPILLSDERSREWYPDVFEKYPTPMENAVTETLRWFLAKRKIK